MADSAPLPQSVSVAITFADGTVGIMQFVTSTPHFQRLATAENVDAEIARSLFDQAKLPIRGWRFVDPVAELPTSRAYRNAWVDTGTAIAHDMVKAREIQRDLLREGRAPLFDQLDQAYLKADEVGDTAEKQRIAGEKQKLRDAPADPAIDAAVTVDDLAKVTLPPIVVSAEPADASPKPVAG